MHPIILKGWIISLLCMIVLLAIFILIFFLNFKILILIFYQIVYVLKCTWYIFYFLKNIVILFDFTHPITLIFSLAIFDCIVTISNNFHLLVIMLILLVNQIRGLLQSRFVLIFVHLWRLNHGPWSRTLISLLFTRDTPILSQHHVYIGLLLLIVFSSCKYMIYCSLIRKQIKISQIKISFTCISLVYFQIDNFFLFFYLVYSSINAFII